MKVCAPCWEHFREHVLKNLQANSLFEKIATECCLTFSALIAKCALIECGNTNESIGIELSVLWLNQHSGTGFGRG